MKLINFNLNENWKSKPIVITFGSFDGCHLGHKFLLEHLFKFCRNANKLVLTFQIPPKFILNKTKPELINSLAEKIEFFKSIKLDGAIIYDFNKEIAEMPPDVFLKNLMKNYPNIKLIIVGHDFKFGYKGEGNSELLEIFAIKNNIGLVVVEPYYYENLRVSSSIIRDLLKNGEIEKANKLLGYEYSQRGIVVEGDKKGREINYPTANIAFLHREKIVPKDGVYLVKVNYRESEYFGALFIGEKYSLTEKKGKFIEVFILDFNENIYGKILNIKFVKFIRDNINFSNYFDLKEQIAKDIQIIKKLILEYSNEK